MIALIFDAVTDPLAGSLSDATRSRWGRRHPWMVAAALPLGLSMFALFSPPAGLGTWGLFAWLTVGAIAVRGAMTLYHVPHNALGAELSEDYAERTRVVGYRVVCGVIGLGLAPALGFFVFLREGPEGAGIRDHAAYTAYAATIGVLMVVTVWISAFGTWSRIPFLARAPEQREAFSPGRLLRRGEERTRGRLLRRAVRRRGRLLRAARTPAVAGPPPERPLLGPLLRPDGDARLPHHDRLPGRHRDLGGARETAREAHDHPRRHRHVHRLHRAAGAAAPRGRAARDAHARHGHGDPGGRDS